MTITKELLWELPEPLVEPSVISDFFSEEMFLRVKNAVNATGLGTESMQFHTMMARWETSVEFDQDIEEYCLSRAREIFKDDTLEKAYFFAVRYQKHKGCVPILWEHTDQNGTQTTIDITIENTADWGLLVEGKLFEQSENEAIVFAGQQHMHARPPYPTEREDVWTTVLFLHFTQPNHWIQEDKHGIRKFGSDGDIRFFNRNRYMALPDPPVNQPVCQCHDYSPTLLYYETIVGNNHNDKPELVDCSIVASETLAPGLEKYSFKRDSARILKGLVQNCMFKRWQPSMVLQDEKKVVDYRQRNCFEVAISETQLSCHPQDPIRRAHESIELIAASCMASYCQKYGPHQILSNQTVLLRYEPGNKFNQHIDDCPEFPRVASMSMFLNDDFDGGELVFPHFGVRIKPVAGDVVVFPSGYAYAHAVEPVVRGIRYAAVKWYDFSKKRTL